MKNRTDLIILILGFALTISGFGAVQNCLTTVFSLDGKEWASFISIFLIYFLFIIGSILAPSISRKIGLRKSLIMASLAYPLYVGILFFDNISLFFIASIILGLSGGLFWNAGIIYIIELTKESQISGIATGILNLLIDFVPAIILIFFSRRISVKASMFLLIFFLISLIGSILLNFLKKINYVQDTGKKLTIKNVIDKRFCAIMPFLFSVGAIYGLSIGALPVYAKSILGTDEYTGTIAGVYLVACCIFNMLVGFLADRIKISSIIKVILACGFVGVLLFLVNSLVSILIGVIFVAANFAGISLNAKIPALYYKGNEDNATAAILIVNKIGILLSSLCGMIIDFKLTILIICLINIIGIFIIKKFFINEIEMQ